MKLAFNTWCYCSFPAWLPAYPIDYVIKSLAKIGYDGIELGCASPVAYPPYISTADRQKIRVLGSSRARRRMRKQRGQPDRSRTQDRRSEL
jgi:sugar phosphate isomerase/epimerase